MQLNLLFLYTFLLWFKIVTKLLPFESCYSHWVAWWMKLALWIKLLFLESLNVTCFLPSLTKLLRIFERKSFNTACCSPWTLHHEGLWELNVSLDSPCSDASCSPRRRLCRPAGSSGRPLHLLRKPLPVPGGEPQVEEPFHLGAKQLHHQLLREQNGEAAGGRLGTTCGLCEAVEVRGDFWRRPCSLISGARERPPPQRDYQLRWLQGLDLHRGIYGADGRQPAR